MHATLIFGERGVVRGVLILGVTFIRIPLKLVLRTCRLDCTLYGLVIQCRHLQLYVHTYLSECLWLEVRDGRSSLSDEVESLVGRVRLDLSNVQYLWVVASGTQRQLLLSVLGSVREREEREKREREKREREREREERERERQMHTMLLQPHIDSDMQVAHKYMLVPTKPT